VSGNSSGVANWAEGPNIGTFSLAGHGDSAAAKKFSASGPKRQDCDLGGEIPLGWPVFRAISAVVFRLQLGTPERFLSARIVSAAVVTSPSLRSVCHD
jgi:hypothetical protein